MTFLRIFFVISGPHCIASKRVIISRSRSGADGRFLPGSVNTSVFFRRLPLSRAALPLKQVNTQVGLLPGRRAIAIIFLC